MQPILRALLATLARHRPEWMVADPDGYFAAAHQRAERELAYQSHGLFPSLRRKQHR